MNNHELSAQTGETAGDDQLIKAAWAFDEELIRRRPGEISISLAGSGTLDPASRARLHQAQAAMEFLFHASTDSLEHTASSFSRAIEVTDDESCPNETDPTKPELPKKFGRFEVVRELGRGGLGVVMLARDPILKREVAVKVPRPEALLTADLRSRFLREAQAAARLTHPNIVAVYEAGQVGVVMYLAAAYCPGTNLAVWLHGCGGTVRRRTAVEIVLKIAEAIDYAHQHGVLHRDLKPGNILLEAFEPSGTTDDQRPLGFIPKISDFGLAKIQDVAGDDTRAGLVMGTPAYMAPEQAEGRLDIVCPATDVYGLGTILYELLTGQPVFRGANDADVLRKVVMDEPVAPRSLRPRIPRDLEAVCLKCLQKEPSHRYPSAARLAADLRRILNGEVTEARTLSLPERFWKWVHRRPAIAAIVLITIFCGSAIAALSGLYSWRLSKELQLSERRRVDAVMARADSEKHRNDVLRERDVNEQYAYAGRMQEAFQALAQGDVEDISKLLAHYEDGTRRAKLRGFEWYHLQRSLAGERLLLRGHKGEIYGVAFSPDGRLLATGGADGTIRLWDPSSGEELRTIYAHANCTNDLDFSPDGRSLASASCDGSIKLWDTRTWMPNRTLTQAKKPMLCVAFSPDGRFLAGGGNGGGLRIWDPAGRIVTTLDIPDPVNAAIWSSDSRYLATPINGAVQLWDTSDWSQQKILAKSVVMSAAFSSGDKMLALNLESDIGFVGVNEREANPSLIGHRGRIFKVLFRPGGTELLSCGEDRTVKIWKVMSANRTPSSDSSDDGTEATENRSLVGHGARVQDMVLAPDGHTLATASFDGTVRLWDLDARGGATPMLSCPVTRLSVGYAPPTFSADLRRLAVYTDQGHVNLWNVDNGQRLLDRDVESEGLSANWFASDLRYFAAWDGDRELLSFQTLEANERIVDSTNYVGKVHDVRLSADGAKAVAGDGVGVRIWNTATGDGGFVYSPPGYSEEERHDFGGRVRPALSSTGRLLAVTNVNSPGLLNLETNAWTDLSGLEGFVADWYFSRDDRYFIVNSYPIGVSVFDTQSGRLVRLLRLQSRVTASACSPDSNTVAVATGRKITLWHAETGQKMGSVATQEEAGSIIHVQFSDDGKHLGAVTAKPADDGTGLATVYVW
ncbi:MAG TPA: protein kinase [Pirellulales bacterium]